MATAQLCKEIREALAPYEIGMHSANELANRLIEVVKDHEIRKMTPVILYGLLARETREVKPHIQNVLIREALEIANKLHDQMNKDLAE